MGKVTTLYLVRHGQSEGNKNKIFLGHTDLDLTELGMTQAEITADVLKDISFQSIYSSDLKRAYNTAAPHAKYRKMSIYKDTGMREIYAGKWEGMTFVDIVHMYPKEWDTFINDMGNSCPPEGETFEQFQNRIVQTILAIARKEEGNTVLVCTHATSIRALYAYANHVSLNDVSKMTEWPRNASYSIFTVEDDNIKVEQYDVCDYLGDKITSLTN